MLFRCSSEQSNQIFYNHRNLRTLGFDQTTPQYQLAHSDANIQTQVSDTNNSGYTLKKMVIKEFQFDNVSSLQTDPGAFSA